MLEVLGWTVVVLVVLVFILTVVVTLMYHRWGTLFGSIYHSQQIAEKYYSMASQHDDDAKRTLKKSERTLEKSEQTLDAAIEAKSGNSSGIHE